MTGSVNVDLANSQVVRTSATNYTNLDFNSAGPFYGQSLNFTIAANGGTARTVVVTATIGHQLHRHGRRRSGDELHRR